MLACGVGFSVVAGFFFFTLRDLLILGSLMIFFVYLKSKPFRNPGLCHANKEDQGQLLGLGSSDLWNCQGASVSKTPLEAGKPEEEEQAPWSPWACIPLIMEG